MILTPELENKIIEISSECEQGQSRENLVLDTIRDLIDAGVLNIVTTPIKNKVKKVSS